MSRNKFDGNALKFSNVVRVLCDFDGSYPLGELVMPLEVLLGPVEGQGVHITGDVPADEGGHAVLLRLAPRTGARVVHGAGADEAADDDDDSQHDAGAYHGERDGHGDVDVHHEDRVEHRATLVVAAHPVIGRVLEARALEELLHGLIVVVDVLRQGTQVGVRPGAVHQRPQKGHPPQNKGPHGAFFSPHFVARKERFSGKCTQCEKGGVLGRKK